MKMVSGYVRYSSTNSHDVIIGFSTVSFNTTLDPEKAKCQNFLQLWRCCPGLSFQWI